MQKIYLLTIDPQEDFCNQTNGALKVPGADQDMIRLGNMVRRLGKKITRWNITMDSHHDIHIAHPVYWVDSNRNHPTPFTIISTNDVRDGKWTTTNPGLFKRSLDYVEKLEKNGRYPLCIWPPHCLIGSPGQNVFAPLWEVVREWCQKNFRTIDWVPKGSNPFTEHYSAVQADVIDDEDHTTHRNMLFVSSFMEADTILWSGEAGSHCLANTGRDISNLFKEQLKDDSFMERVTLLTDATSPVPGFEQLQKDFIDEMVGRGMKLSTTVKFLA